MKTISRSKLGNIAMVEGGEDKISKVILDGVLKEWVAIGWIDLRKATAADKRKYPKVSD